MKPRGARKSVRKLLAALLLLPLVAGCAQAGKEIRKTAAVDPPPPDVEQTMLQAAEAKTTSVKDGLTVYLQDRNGYIAPMTLRAGTGANDASSPERTALVWLTREGRFADQLPPGFSPMLPQGTKIRSAKTDSGTVSIDFAAPFPAVPANQERKIVEAIVWTMTELPGIGKVRLSVDGLPLRELPSSGLPLPETLTRDIGINLEQAAGTNASRSMAVTLYFSARSEEGEGYFVPVTRLIDRQPDRNRAALEELIKGPMDDRKLQPVFAPGVSVERVVPTSEAMNVELKDPSWEPEMTVPSETIEALVLTLTEETGIPKARIILNGESSFKDSDNRTYADPVERPAFINALAS